MKIEEQLKLMILQKYKSIRAFSIASQIPYSTIDSILKNGINGASVKNVAKICDMLDIDMDNLAEGFISKKNSNTTPAVIAFSDKSDLIRLEDEESANKVFIDPEVLEMAEDIYSDNDFRQIQRARKRMTQEDRDMMTEFMKMVFKKYFEDDDE